MIYFHQTPGIVLTTGYGGAFQGLYHALLANYPALAADVCAHPFYHFQADKQADIDLFFGVAKGCLRHFYMDRYGTRKGMFTMCETDPMPEEFVEMISQYFEFIVVPTRWVQGIFERTFPDLPVYYVPLGVNSQLFPKLVRKRSGSEPFTFIWQGFVFRDRKRSDLVEQAFRELKLPNSRLIVKALAKATKKQIELHLPPDHDGVQYIQADYSFAEMISLWQRCDFAVIPSEGEAVGLIPLEMMSTGLPVALADNTGASEYCDEHYNYPMACDVEQPSFGDGAATVRIPSIDEIKRVMTHAYENRAEIAATGQAASSWIHEEHSYGKASDYLAQVFRRELAIANGGENVSRSENIRAATN